MELWKRTLYVCLFGAFMASVGLSQAAPLIPLYLQDLGVHDQADLANWSGLAMGMTYLMVALFAPFWGKLADRKGRKLILLRASLGMAITNALLGFAQAPEHIVIIRILNGMISGFFSGSITLVATQTPQTQTGWALGLLSAANLGGSLLGPMIGGYIGGLFGIRYAFFIVSALLGTAFLSTLFFVKEEFTPQPKGASQSLATLKASIPDWKGLIYISVGSFIFAFTTMATAPILSVFVQQIVGQGAEHIALLAGLAFTVTGLAQMVASSVLGKYIDKLGPRFILWTSFIYVGLVTIPQAFVNNIYTLCILRFLLGIGLGGLLPGINTYLSSITPKAFAGQVFAYNQSTLFMGYFIGSLGGSFIASQWGFGTMFITTGAIIALTGVFLKVTLGRTRTANH